MIQIISYIQRMLNLNKEGQVSMELTTMNSPLQENQLNLLPQPTKPHQTQTKAYFFQTETKRLKAYYLTNKQKLLGRTILFNNDSGKVRYFGTLQHEGVPVNGKDELWIGIQWDVLYRGKHNGTVNGFTYFVCANNQGSLIKYEKIQFGYKLETALFKRYFKASELHHAKDIYQNLKEIKEEVKNEPIQSKQTKTQELMIKKIHKIQYDSEAYFQTIKKTKKIMIEFVGFDQIWTKLNNLDKIQSISLADCRICDLGSLGNLNSLLKSLKILSLQNNYLSDWKEIYHLGYELPELQELSVSYNLLNHPEDNFQDLKEIKLVTREQVIDLTSKKSLFPRLKCLILINTGLTWKSFFKVLPAFAQVQEFILCKNNLVDVENICEKRLLYLQAAKFLNLQETQLKRLEDIMKFNSLPNLEKLTLNKNTLNELTRKTTGFTALKHLSIQHCNFTKPVILYEASLFPNLESLNVKHNPIGDKLGNLYVRMRAVAEIPKLTQINGAQLKKYQRKDCEIFYLRQAFREYFAYKKVPDYDYDYQDFMKYCEENHPNIERLIKKYGNPYEVEKKEIKEIIKEEVKDTETKKGTGMVDIFMEYKETGFLDKKKVPLSWTLSNLKNFFTKTIKIPIAQLKLTLFNDKTAQSGQEMLEDHKSLNYYILKAGMKIVVERKS